MKKIYQLLLISLISLYMLIACQGSFSPGTSPATTTPSVTFKEYSFEVDNSTPEALGYEALQHGEDIGVKAIAIAGDWAILSDPYHNNLKKINLSTGKMISGPQIAPSPNGKQNIWLGELAVFHDKIYVGAQDSIFSFDLNLNKIGSTKVARGTKEIWMCTEDSLQIITGSKQLNNQDIELSLFSVTAQGVEAEITKIIPLEVKRKRSLATSSAGISYRVDQKGDGFEFISNAGHRFPIPSQIPQILEYDAKNVAFSKDRLVYFTSSPESFRIYSYQFLLHQ